MGDKHNTNPILPAPGVSRNPATSTAASRTATGRQYDDGSVNRDTRLRGEMSDKGRGAGALLRCKSLLRIGTHNVNTIREENRAAELEQQSNTAGIDILGVQEHRIIHDDPIEFRKISNSYLVTSRGWRNDVQASQ